MEDQKTIGIGHGHFCIEVTRQSIKDMVEAAYSRNDGDAQETLVYILVNMGGIFLNDLAIVVKEELGML